MVVTNFGSVVHAGDRYRWNECKAPSLLWQAERIIEDLVAGHIERDRIIALEGFECVKTRVDLRVRRDRLGLTVEDHAGVVNMGLYAGGKVALGPRRVSTTLTVLA
jgi:hypothetical protein